MADKNMSHEDSIRAAMAELEGAEAESSKSSDSTADEVQTLADDTKVEAPAEETEGEADVAEPESEDVEEGESEKSQESAPKQGEVQEGAEDDTDDYEPPAFLDEEGRKELKSLPKSARPLVDRFLRRRDMQFQRWTTKVRQDAQEAVNQAVLPYTGIEEAIQPHVSRLRLQGKPLATVIGSTLEWDQLLESNTLEGLAQLCESKRIHPKAIFDYMQSGNRQIPVSGVSPSSDGSRGTESGELQELRAKVQTLEQQTARNQWTGLVDTLAATRDEQGQPRYPYYQDIRREMSKWIVIIGEENPEAQPQELFDRAYQKACWANDNIRALMMQDRTSAQSARKIQKKKAAVSLPASSSGGIASKTKTPQSENMTHEESIRAAIEELGVEL